MTLPYAEVIGDPISHSKSPVIHRFWLSKLGLKADYRSSHVRPDQLEDYFKDRSHEPLWRGCNITLPHKETARAYADEADERVTAIGATNCVLPSSSGKLVATNSDVDGVAQAVSGMDLAGSKVGIIGAGGASRAAFGFFAEKGCGQVNVLARDMAKARAVAGRFDLSVEVFPIEGAHEALEGASLFVNATQLGMTGQAEMPDALLVALSGLTTNALVFDMVYAPLETELLKAAGRIGLQTADGLTMLVGQAATAFRHFFGEAPPREYDADLRELLTV